MNVTFKPSAWEQYADWQKTDKTILTKINALILECQRHPFEGTGKPEPLRGDYAGYLSRRITREHRLVYRVNDEGLMIVQCRFHY